MAEEIRESREEELERIRQIEASSEYQEKLQILREKMKLNLRWKMYKIAMVIGAILLFAMFKFVGLGIAAVLGFIFVYPVFKRKRELFREKKQRSPLRGKVFISHCKRDLSRGRNEGHTGLSSGPCQECLSLFH